MMVSRGNGETSFSDSSSPDSTDTRARPRAGEDQNPMGTRFYPGPVESETVEDTESTSRMMAGG
ncbi:hypothetical protein JMJ77_0006464 [Colletotrichum scovillei]|uniref:Uncharacterized protein n=1 Tax=Colletotrichum scovillei TaxID=1209932 RepID=A0A9P7UML0_9PEZI|nr:hypothetical protein JMJ77_0006464 [Colletotrichum scovillei]KAG7077702.1 hypothetical protein JMJ76_0014946 [Colletotrichum scovillei]KAG7084834.1 hypothetical protein JMJ78_0010266 [Colletotrichum scovillei]